MPVTCDFTWVPCSVILSEMPKIEDTHTLVSVNVVHTTICVVIVEMHRHTVRILPGCLRLNLVRVVSSASPLISLLRDKPLIRLWLCDPTRHYFIHVRQFVPMLLS